MFRRTLGTIVAVVLTAGTGPFAQPPAPPQSPPTFNAGTEVVRLEVGVLDRERRPVRDLTAADFTVLENGRERPVVAFTAVELPTAAPAEGTASWLEDAPRDVVSNVVPDEGRLVVVAFDWSIRPHDITTARNIARAAISGLGRGDQAAIVFIEPSANAGVPQNFTADRALLRAAVERPFATALTDPETMGLINPDRIDTGLCQCGTCTLEALTRTASSLRDVSRRPKVILLIGTYVRSFAPVMGPRVAPVIPGVISPGLAFHPSTCSFPLMDARRALERATGEANATIHVIDPVGLDIEESTPLPGRMRERRDSLPVLADLTGGRTVMGTNEPQAHVASILDESGSYYVLGFTPASTTRDGRSNRIEVRVRRPDVTVSARDRYTREEEPVSALASDDAGLIRTLGGVLSSADVPLEVSVVPMLTSGRPGAAVFVVGRLSGDAATARENVSLLSAAFTPRGRSVASKRVTLRPTDAGEGTRSSLGVVAGLPLEPGNYEVRVAAERPGATGSVHTFVEVPDFGRKKLALSGLLLHVAPEEVAAPREEIDGMLPFVPTARRVFQRTEVVSTFMQITQGTTRSDSLQAVTVQVRIVDAHGSAVRDQSMTIEPDRFMAGRSTNVRFSLPVGALTAGQYLLTVDARAGEDLAARTVRFEVR